MRRTIIGAASVLAMTLALAACATAPTSTQLADGTAKPKKAQTYNPAFQNSLDALNNPAITFTNAGPRLTGGFAR